MAFVHGSNATLSIDGTAISAYTDNVSLSRDVDLAETSTFSVDDKTYVAGLEGATITASGSWDATGDAVLHGCFDQAQVAWAYSPDAGTTTYSGNAFVTNYSVQAATSDKVAWNVSLTVTGAVARA